MAEEGVRGVRWWLINVIIPLVGGSGVALAIVQYVIIDKCVPGNTQECHPCPPGYDGGQMCAADGKSWGGCQCLACAPGTPGDCVCDNHKEGRARCNETGTGWEGCFCEPSVEPVAHACVPNASQSCACLGGRQGVQACARDGLSWGDCSCPVCEADQQQKCDCPGGLDGTQTCAGGTQWSKCECANAPPEQLTKDQIRDTMRSAISRSEDCWKAVSGTSTTRVRVFVDGATGAVTSVAPGAGATDDPVFKCFAERIKAERFPQFNGILTFDYPITFQPPRQNPRSLYRLVPIPGVEPGPIHDKQPLFGGGN